MGLLSGDFKCVRAGGLVAAAILCGGVPYSLVRWVEVHGLQPQSLELGRGGGAGREGEWAGIYCPRDRQIVIDLTDHLVVRAAAGDDLADDALGYVLAHEVGHHVQYTREILVRQQTQEDQVRIELYADCMSGVWGRAAGRRAPPAWSYATTDVEHGTGAQQREWTERGYARGRPADCDAIWDADVL